MDDKLKSALLARDSEEIERLYYEDDATSVFFAVDWRADETEVVDDCAQLLGLDGLAADWGEDGEALTITYQGEQTSVVLVHDVADRHEVVAVLNRLLQPEYEIRYFAESMGSDTAGFAVMPSSDWADLESASAEAVAEHFVKLEGLPNVFTELRESDLPEVVRSRLKQKRSRAKGKRKWWPW